MTPDPTGCPQCGSDDYICLDFTGYDPSGTVTEAQPDYDGPKQCQECGEEWT